MNTLPTCNSGAIMIRSGVVTEKGQIEELSGLAAYVKRVCMHSEVCACHMRCAKVSVHV